MKETLNISISGISFIAEKDAYAILKDYFERLELACKSDGEEGREIAEDIEARVAELLLSRQKEFNEPIDLKTAEWVVEQMGDIDEISFGDKEKSKEKNSQYTSPIPKRLYRVKEGARLGGIFSGLGIYFNIDTNLMRLGLMLVILTLMLLGGSFASGVGIIILTYIIAWIVIPVATTPRQKLELEGRPVTTDSIRESFRSSLNNNDKGDKTASALTGTLYIISKVVKFIIYAAIILICMILGVSIISIIAGGYTVLTMFYDTWAVWLGSSLYLLGSIAIWSVAAPLSLLFYLFIKILTSKPMRAIVVWPLVTIWVASWTLAGIFGIKEPLRFNHDNRIETDFNITKPSGDTLFVRSISGVDTTDPILIREYTDISTYTSDDRSYYVTVRRQSSGSSEAEALQLASAINFNIYQRGDTLFVDDSQLYTKPGSYRKQKIKLRIGVPKGGQVLIDNNLSLHNKTHGGRINGMFPMLQPEKRTPKSNKTIISTTRTTDGTREIIVL
ncbi:MAG: PspC domain-containing protein [Rikenellaceae bacterium]|nr:PspC domain-containing protein [Rikenellaceae bacterium]MDE7356054.1 PspC domain-containing protein [Rikenellaceae bacterium]